MSSCSHGRFYWQHSSIQPFSLAWQTIIGWKGRQSRATKVRRFAPGHGYSGSRFSPLGTDDSRETPIMSIVRSENQPAPESYATLLGEIKERIRSAQYAALRAVNRELIELYWDIGKLIVERQSGKTWGRSVVENLAKDLQAEFPGISGFSAANLWRIKNFYEAYAANEKLAPLVREISWTKNLVILERCKDDAEREFYLRRTRQFGWTKNVLIHQIENRTYEKTMASQTNFDVALPAEIGKQAKLAVKDEYTFDFLELADEHSERQLEQAILAKIEPFLLEMGGCSPSLAANTELTSTTKSFSLISSCSIVASGPWSLSNSRSASSSRSTSARWTALLLSQISAP